MKSDTLETVYLNGKNYLAEPAVISHVRNDWAWGLSFTCPGTIIGSPSYNQNFEYGRNLLANLLTNLWLEDIEDLVGQDCYILIEREGGMVLGVTLDLDCTQSFIFPR